MQLESLVVSRDWSEVSVVECILSSLHIGVDVEKHVDAALHKLAHRKVDAIVVDCDLEGATGLVESWRNLRGSENTVPLIVMGQRTNSRPHLREVAEYRFDKPISVDRAVRTLSAARNQILQGRLRYHRQAISIPIEMIAGRKHVQGLLVNISQGGMGVVFDEPVHMNGSIAVQFQLPNETTIAAKGQVVWCDPHGHAGIRFQDVTADHRKQLKMWIAGQYFEDSPRRNSE